MSGYSSLTTTDVCKQTQKEKRDDSFVILCPEKQVCFRWFSLRLHSLQHRSASAANMNLGDGLLLHLENGKPQLVLLHRGDISGIDKLYRPGLPRRPKGPLPSSSTRRSTVTSRNSSKTPANHTTVGKTRAVSVLSEPERSRPRPRVPSSNRTTKTPANGRTGQKDALANGDTGMRESLARLTSQEPTARSTPHNRDEEEVLELSADQTQASLSPSSPEASLSPSSPEASLSPSSPEPEQSNPWLLPLGAPPPALAPPQARAPSLAALVSPPRALATPPGRGREGPSSNCGGRASFLRSMTALLDPAELEERERRRCKQQEQLRAIEAQLAEQREQREEEKRRQEEEEEEEEQRKMKEHVEQNNTWLLPLRAPPQALAPPPSVAAPVSPPQALATPPGPGWGGEASSCGERASFLRSMTALLDPAELDERDRRRCKQQEQLRAIEAQLAEQREQREEEKRRQEEEEKKRKEQGEQNPQQQEGLLSSEKPIRELPRSRDVVMKQHPVSIRGPKGGQGATGEEQTRSKRRGKGDLHQGFARTERTDTPRGLHAVRPPGPSSPNPQQDYFPYVRTADIIHLEPLDRNGTATPHPTNTHGQKEILQSLAALRKGLLQKQKELETSGRLLPSVTSQRS